MAITQNLSQHKKPLSLRMRAAITVLSSVLCTNAICLFFASVQPYSIAWFLLAVCISFPLWHTWQIAERRLWKYVLPLSALFTLLLVIGNAAVKDFKDVYTLLFFGKSVQIALGFFILLAALVLLGFDFVLRQDFVQQAKKTPFLCESRKSFWLTVLVLFSCWLPYFILFSPGILTHDSAKQLAQAMGETPLINHHPIIHTLLITLCLRFGDFVWNPTFGVVLYSLTQMFLFALCCSYAVRTLSRFQVKNFLRWGVLLYFALLPTNALYSFSMWKDILFGGIALVTIAILFQMAKDPAAFFSSWKRIIPLALLLFLFCTFRNNGLYAFLLFSPFFLFAFRKHWKKATVLVLIPLLMVAAYYGPFFSALAIEDGSIAEGLSIPLQQFARTVRDHESELSPEELGSIGEILPVEKIKELYKPKLSDNIKGQLNTQAFSAAPSRYLSLWFRLFLRHPVTYIESFLMNSFGYWYPDSPYWITAYEIHGNPFGVSPLNPIPPVRGGVIGLQNTLLPKLPTVSMLYSIGFMVWLLFTAITLLLYKRRGTMLLPIGLLLAVWLTTLASPVHSEYRYIYSLMLATPICLCIALLPSADKTRNIPD